MVDETGTPAKAVIEALRRAEEYPDGSGGMNEEPVQKVDAFNPYLGFVVTGVALSLIAISALSTLQPNNSFFEFLWLAVFFGSVVWGPVAVLALFPGWWVFCWIRRAIRGRRWFNVFGTFVASLAVAAIGALGGTLAFGFIVGINDGLFTEDGFFAFLGVSSVLFAIGSIGALLSGLLFYWREDQANG